MTINRFDNHQLDHMMANCLIMLSNKYHLSKTTAAGDADADAAPPPRMFECNTCEKKFSSFQALGGHRASHKKPKLQPHHHHHPLDNHNSLISAARTKTHECAICGLEFPMGQALGGHMRRHRAALTLLPAVAMMKKKSSASKIRVKCLDLDLNLTPLQNYDLKLQLGNALPTT